MHPSRGIADQEVEPAELLADRREQALDLGWLGHVRLREQCARAARLDLGGRAARRVVALAVVDDHVRTVAREPQRDGAPDTSRAAGDQCDPTREGPVRHQW